MKINRILSTLAALSIYLLGAFAVSAQTAPNWTYGYVPTTAQWNAVFAGKQDWLGAPPVLTTGSTMTGPLITAASTTSRAGLNLPPGTAPTAPNNGDVWTTAAGMFVRINGVTVGPLSGPSGGSFAATAPLAVTFPAGVTTFALNYDSTLTLSGSSLTLNLTNPNTWSGQQTFVAPILGAATATSINKVAITAPATSATLTIADGKTLTVSNSLTFTGTDATSFSFPSTSGAIMTAASTATMTGKTFDTAGAGNSFLINGVAVTANTGTGAIARAAAPTISSPTFTTAFTATGLVGLTNLASQSANTILAAATAGSPVAMAAPSCSGAANALQWLTGTGLQCGTITAAAATITVGTTTVTSGTANELLYNNAGVLGNLASANNGVLITSGAGAPSISSTLPSALTIPSPTFTGTVAGAGTIPSSVLTNTTVTAASYGSSTSIPSFTVNAQGQLTAAAGNVVIAPAGTLSGTTLNSTVVTSSLTTVGTIGTGVWQGTIVGGTYGGTGVNNGANTITVAGNFSTAAAVTHAGAFATTITATAITNSTLPAGTHTLAGLDVAQTWTALQTYSDQNLRVLTPSGAGGLVIRTGAGSTAATLIFPNASTDFSATGGTGQFVKQSTSGGAFSVATILAADLPLATTGAFGAVKPDGTTITIAAGVITASGGSATAVTVGTTSVVSCGTAGGVLYNNSSVLGCQSIASALGSRATLVTVSTALNTGATTGTGGFVSGTYTTPSNVLWLEVIMVGGGGGGGASAGTISTGTGGTGGSTTFGSSFLTAAGGVGGTAGVGGGVGGACTVNAGATGLAVTGGSGAAGALIVSGAFQMNSGVGGSSALGGAGTGGSGSPTNGSPGAANTGAGGGGGLGNTNGATNPYSGSGGGAGCYIRVVIPSPSATYSYSVGTGGAAGSAGYPGGAGGTGGIWVFEHYNSFMMMAFAGFRFRRRRPANDNRREETEAA